MNDKNRRLADFKRYLKFLEGCCLDHPDDYHVEDVVDVLAWTESEKNGAPGGAVFALMGGTFGALEEWQDYTGHG